ncbi:MAG: prenyltransferase/squalene oxidase repeat-containing protein [Terriglobia bacterium]
MKSAISRRQLLSWTLAAAGNRLAVSAASARLPESASSPIDALKIKSETLKFIEKCARDDGGYSPSPDPEYPGDSDTAESDLAAVTYAATLAKTVGWKLPRPDRSADFIQRHQQSNGIFINFQGKLDPKEDLAVLYNTTQGVVSLRALGEKPKVDPVGVLDRFFEKGAFKKLPWYTVSFYPLFYAALGKRFPPEQQAAMAQHIVQNQAADGYLGDHVAATFHMVHFFRLIGEPTPCADAVVKRVLRDQRPDGGWHLKPPDWDVHSCFDAVFILRQLSWNSPPSRAAIQRAAEWALACQTPDGGFSHYRHEHADMDAVYFQLGTLIQAERVPGANYDLPDAATLSWGHAMKPGKIYV